MLTTAYCLLQDISYYSLNLCAFEWDYTYKRVLIVRNFETRLSVAYLVEGSIGEVCCGQGEVLRNLSRMPVPEVESFLPLRLTVSSPALVQLRGPTQFPWRRSLQQRYKVVILVSAGNP